MERKKIQVNCNKPITLDMGIDEFISYCKAKNLRPTTIKSYEERASSIYKFIQPKTLIRDIDQSTIDGFISYCKNVLQIQDITINSYLRALRTILYYFMKLDYMNSFKISLIRADKPIIECYTKAEIKLLLAKPKGSYTFVDYRDWVISNVLYSTGMRCSNILNLQIKDIDLVNDWFILRTTKNRRSQMIPICKSLRTILKEYLAIRNGIDTDDYVFCNAYGEKLSRDGISSTMRRYNNNRGVKRTGIHRWRHTFAREYLMANGGNIYMLQKALNHSSLDVVKNYVEIFNQDLEKSWNESNPLENLLHEGTKKTAIKIKK